MTMPGQLAVADTAGQRPPALASLAGMASLAPLGLNLAVGLQPVFASGGAMDAGGRAAAVAVYTLGLGLGQPMAGNAADRWGRRPTLLAGLLLAGVGALLAAAAGHGDLLLLGRFVTGLGLAVCLVVPRASLRDLHQGAELQRSMAVLAMVFAVAPAVTPPLAWLLADAGSWRAPMALLALLVLCALAGASRAFRETRPATTGVPDRAAWLALGRRRIVQRASLALAGAAAPFFIVAAAGPAALQASTGAGPGLIAAVLGGTYLGFALGNQWVRRRAAVAGDVHMAHGLAIVAAGIALLAATLWWPALWLWTLALALFAVGHGLVFPAAFALVLQKMPQQAGLATAGIGTVHMCTGAASAWVAGALPLSVHQAVVLVAAVLVAAGCAAWFLLPSDKDHS
jgi:DHA1 family bicyclomycin/chloramphenicol resistance-like MFS transporter